MKYLKLHDRPIHYVNDINEVITYISKEYSVNEYQIKFTKCNDSYYSYDDIYNINLYSKLGELFAVVGIINFKP